MTFREEMFRAVLAGRKTVTRRLSCRVAVGREYAVQPGRGKPGHPGVKMLVTSVRKEPLAHALVGDEAKLEGFDGPAEFHAYWMDMWKTWQPELEVWRIEFRLVREQRRDACPECGAERVELVVVPGRFYCPACQVATPGPAEPAPERLF